MDHTADFSIIQWYVKYRAIILVVPTCVRIIITTSLSKSDHVNFPLQLIHVKELCAQLVRSTSVIYQCYNVTEIRFHRF